MPTSTRARQFKKSKAKRRETEDTPTKSRIRKRPVGFGNPALGTYHGHLYTLEGDTRNASLIERPVIDGAESADRVVAMVDVPPEQVPDGILNLARSHRPYINHVRIVIAEGEVLDMSTAIKPTSTEETKEEPPSLTQLSITPTPENHPSPLVAVSAIESAASILAADEELQAINEQLQQSNNHAESVEMQHAIKNDVSNALHLLEKKLDGEVEDDNFSASCRTYAVLLEMCSDEGADGIVEDLHGKPYTSFDETQVCSVHHVVALSGEDGVSLLSPFFAPSTQSTSPKSGTATLAAASATLPTSAAALQSEGRTRSTPPPVGKANHPSARVATNVTSAATTHTEDYNCAVCLEHMNLDDQVLPSSILTTVCNHSFHLDCLLKWQDSPCPVCRYDHSGLNETLSQCHICGTTEHNYVCLICGVVSCSGPPSFGIPAADASANTSDEQACGVMPDPIPPSSSQQASRLSHSHARKHYDNTLHAYALDTETQHVWDFAGQGFVHRLLQNKEDGKLVEVNDPTNTSSHERSLNPGLSDAQEGEVLHRKLEGFASQYYTLLKSQLEQQRIFYEGRLEEMRREGLMRRKAQTSDLISALKQERNQLAKRLVSLKAREQKVKEDVVFLKSMNESLEANKAPMKRKVKDAQRQRIESRDMLQQCLPALEEKVHALMLQLTADDSGSGAAAAEECAPAHSTEDAASIPRADSIDDDERKPPAKT